MHCLVTTKMKASITPCTIVEFLRSKHLAHFRFELFHLALAVLAKEGLANY